MKNKRRAIAMCLALLLATLGTFALVGYVSSAKDKAVADEALVDVYIVDELIPKGADAASIKAAVTLEQVPARLEQDGAIDDLDAVGTNVAASDLLPGDQLVAARLAAEDQVSEDLADKVQISTLLTAEQAVGGSLQRGDLVGVYLSFDPFEVDVAGVGADGTPADGAAAATDGAASTTRKTPNVTRLEFQHILVTNVQTIEAPVAGAEDDGEDVAQVTGKEYVVTLALSPEQSERFVFALEFGHVWLSIEPASVTDDGTRLVTLGNVHSTEVK